MWPAGSTSPPSSRSPAANSGATSSPEAGAASRHRRVRRRDRAEARDRKTATAGLPVAVVDPRQVRSTPSCETAPPGCRSGPARRQLLLAERIHARQVARDVLLVRLDRAAADFHQLRVAPQALDPVLSDVAIAAKHLDRAVGDLLG